MKNRSCFYDLKRKEIPGGQIVYINGMRSLLPQAKESAKRISTNFAQGYNIHGVYAASNGKYMDYAEAALGYGGVATTPAFMLQKQVRDFLTRDPNAQCTVVCFSKGAIHTNSALATLEKPLCERVTVLAVAPADLIPPGTCRKIRHFIITEDRVLFFSPSAHRIGKKDPDIVILPPHKDRSNAHNPHGPSYKEAISKEVDLFIKECKHPSETH